VEVEAAGDYTKGMTLDTLVVVEVVAEASLELGELIQLGRGTLVEMVFVTLDRTGMVVAVVVLLRVAVMRSLTYQQGKAGMG
jgi:hypothetical protein